MSRQLYNIVLPHQAGAAHAQVLADVARLVYASLTSLGHPCEISINHYCVDRMNILIGYHALAPVPELRRAPFVIYQLEQLTADDQRFDPSWLDVLGLARMVWDYSSANVRYLKQHGLTNLRYVPLGYHPALATIPQEAADVDVLHYGSMNARRREVMLSLQLQCRLMHLFDVYGAQRDAVIARSKIVLNLHMSRQARFEQVRVSYLLNNGRFVISEAAEDNPYEGMVLTCPYDQIAQTCRAYLSQDELRNELARQAAERFRQIRMEELVRSALN